MKLLTWIYGWIVGLALYLMFAFIRPFVKIEIKGKEELDENKNYIFACWHQYNPISYQVWIPGFKRLLGKQQQAWLQHPVWRMKAIHILIKLVGVDHIILGSSGHSGKEAAKKLETFLSNGCSTVINPDGPAGPAKQLKKGILHLALNTGLAIVPFKVISNHYWTFPSWDQKRFPFPFTKITLKFEVPIKVASDNFSELIPRLSNALGK